MLALAPLMLGLAVGPLAVRSQLQDKPLFNFSFSTIEQCGPVNVSVFQGNSPVDPVPITLTLLPFNSTPISIPIPNFNEKSTAIFFAFLPLAAETTFVASLDDAAGNSVFKTSDVTKVLPSPSGDSSCIPSASNVPSPQFVLDATPSQCQSFNVTYNPTVIAEPPSVRAFIPRGSVILLNQTNDPTTKGIATYTMPVKRGKQVVLLIDGGSNHRATTTLITVDGDSSSSSSCIVEDNPSGDSSAQNSKSPKLSRTAIIAIAAGVGGFVAVTAVLMVLYVLKERRLARIRGVALSDRSHKEGASGNWAPTMPRSPSEQNTYYKRESFESPGSSYALNQRPFWAQETRVASPTSLASVTEVNPPYVTYGFNSPYTLRNSQSYSAALVPDNQQTLQQSERDIETMGGAASTYSSISSLELKNMFDVTAMHLGRDSVLLRKPPLVNRTESRTSNPLMAETVTAKPLLSVGIRPLPDPSKFATNASGSGTSSDHSRNTSKDIPAQSSMERAI